MYLLTGVTGYVGGRLLRRFEREGQAVRCLCRNPDPLRSSVLPTTELLRGDLLDASSLDTAFSGVSTAFYLVHSMNAGAEFEERERQAATNFAQAARRAGVLRIVYLGGLVEGSALSPHMRSRLETGDLLRSAGISVIELQSSVIIGSGSASFEVIRSLIDRLPVMITPRWVNMPAQPIAIEDVIEYLVQAARLPVSGSTTVQIGGADVTSYVGIMREYARQRNLHRWIVRVPFLTPSLSSRWLTLITPVYAAIGRYLIESVRNASVVRNPLAHQLFSVRPMGIQRAIERALINEARDRAESRWCDAGGKNCRDTAPAKDVLSNEQQVRVPVNVNEAFAPIRRIGGETGWYCADSLWRLRGLIDLMMGGVGMRRGRPDAETPEVGSTLDFWRVEAYEPDRKLRLFAEMRVPGRAWLEFRAEPVKDGTLLTQVAQFEPRGFLGLAYWYLLWPVHAVMFRSMLRRISKAV